MLSERTAVAQVQSLLCGFLQEGSCPFSAGVTVEDMVDLIGQECVETADRIFTPVVTLWTFCVKSIVTTPRAGQQSRVSTPRASPQGLAPCSPRTGRANSATPPETLLSRLVPVSGQRLQQQTPRA